VILCDICQQNQLMPLEYKLQKMLTNPSRLTGGDCRCGTGHVDNRIQQNIQAMLPEGAALCAIAIANVQVYGSLFET
jgi:hypothetical protein